MLLEAGDKNPLNEMVPVLANNIFFNIFLNTYIP